MEIKDKLIAAGGKVWEKEDLKRIYLSQDLVNKCDFGITFNEKKHKLYFDCVAGKFSGSSECFVKALNAQI